MEGVDWKWGKAGWNWMEYSIVEWGGVESGARWSRMEWNGEELKEEGWSKAKRSGVKKGWSGVE